MDYQESCKSISSQEIKLDAGEIEEGIEQHSADAARAESSTKETNEAEEDSGVKPSGMDTTTEEFEPGGGGGGDACT